MTPLIPDPTQALIDNALAVFKNTENELLKIDYYKLLIAKKRGSAVVSLKKIPGLESNRAVTRLLNRAKFKVSTRTVDDYVFVDTFWDDIVKVVGPDNLKYTGYKRAIQLVREQAKLLTYVPPDDGWKEKSGGFNRTYESGRHYAIHPATIDDKRCWMLNGDLPEEELIDPDRYGMCNFFPTLAEAKAKADALERLDRRNQTDSAQPVHDRKETLDEVQRKIDKATNPNGKPPTEPALKENDVSHPAAREAQDAVIEGDPDKTRHILKVVSETDLTNPALDDDLKAVQAAIQKQQEGGWQPTKTYDPTTELDKARALCSP